MKVKLKWKWNCFESETESESEIKMKVKLKWKWNCFESETESESENEIEIENEKKKIQNVFKIKIKIVFISKSNCILSTWPMRAISPWRPWWTYVRKLYLEDVSAEIGANLSTYRFVAMQSYVSHRICGKYQISWINTIARDVT
jgi:hypothetical protein